MPQVIPFITAFGSAVLAGATGGILGSVAAGTIAGTLGVIAGSALLSQGLNALNKPKAARLGGNLSAQKSAIGTRALILGRTAVGGNLCTDLMRSGRNSGVATQVIGIGGCGPVGTIESVIWGADTLTFSGSAGSIQVVSSPSKYSGKPLWMVQKSGAWDQTAININSGGSGLESGAHPSAWRSTDRLGGFLAAMMIYGAENPIFEQNFHIPVFVVDASSVPLIDPRTLSAATTQSQKRNPWVWAYSFARGFYSETNVKTVGIGLSASLIDTTSFATAANTADSNSWTVAGVLQSNPSSMWADMQSIAQAGGGSVTIRSGKLAAIVSAARSSIGTITEDDLAAPPVITAAFEGSTIPNRIIPRFISEDNAWAAVDGSVVTDAAFVTAQGGRQITDTIEFPLCGGGGDQAGVLAAYSLVNAREPLSFALSLKPQARYIGQAGDCVTLALPNSGLSSHKVVITEIAYGPDLSLQIKAISETDTKHDYALGKTSVPPDYSITTPYDVNVIPTPSIGSWTATASTLEGGGSIIPVINLTGASDWIGATGIVIKAKLASGGDWLISELISPNATSHQLRGLQPSTDYIVGVAYIGLNYKEGVPLSLSAVTLAGTIVGQAASVEWSGVTGSNKPEDNATYNVGALADLNQVDTNQIVASAVSETTSVSLTPNKAAYAQIIPTGGFGAPSAGESITFNGVTFTVATGNSGGTTLGLNQCTSLLNTLLTLAELVHAHTTVNVAILPYYEPSGSYERIQVFSKLSGTSGNGVTWSASSYFGGSSGTLANGANSAVAYGGSPDGVKRIYLGALSASSFSGRLKPKINVTVSAAANSFAHEFRICISRSLGPNGASRFIKDLYCTKVAGTIRETYNRDSVDFGAALNGSTPQNYIYHFFLDFTRVIGASDQVDCTITDVQLEIENQKR
jgi:hypothetical protein